MDRRAQHAQHSQQETKNPNPTKRTPSVRRFTLLADDRKAVAPSPVGRKSHASCKANIRSFSSTLDHFLVFLAPLLLAAMVPRASERAQSMVLATLLDFKGMTHVTCNSFLFT